MVYESLLIKAFQAKLWDHWHSTGNSKHSYWINYRLLSPRSVCCLWKRKINSRLNFGPHVEGLPVSSHKETEAVSMSRCWTDEKVPVWRRGRIKSSITSAFWIKVFGAVLMSHCSWRSLSRTQLFSTLLCSHKKSGPPTPARGLKWYFTASFTLLSSPHYTIFVSQNAIILPLCIFYFNLHLKKLPGRQMIKWIFLKEYDQHRELKTSDHGCRTPDKR